MNMDEKILKFLSIPEDENEGSYDDKGIAIYLFSNFLTFLKYFKGAGLGVVITYNDNTSRFVPIDIISNIISGDVRLVFESDDADDASSLWEVCFPGDTDLLIHAIKVERSNGRCATFKFNIKDYHLDNLEFEFTM